MTPVEKAKKLIELDKQSKTYDRLSLAFLMGSDQENESSGVYVSKGRETIYVDAHLCGLLHEVVLKESAKLGIKLDLYGKEIMR